MLLLKFEKEIKGGSKQAGYVDWIEIQSFALSAARNIDAKNSERNPGTAHVSELMLTKGGDRATSELIIQSCIGESLGKATLHELQTNGKGELQPVMEMEFSDAIISAHAYQGGKNSPAIENFSVNFTSFSHKANVYSGDVVKPGTSKMYDLVKRAKG